MANKPNNALLYVDQEDKDNKAFRVMVYVVLFILVLVLLWALLRWLLGLSWFFASRDGRRGGSLPGRGQGRYSLPGRGQGRYGTGAEPLEITSPSALPNGATQAPYRYSLESTGGSGAIRWSRVSGDMPPGMSLNRISGELSGIPTALGQYAFTIRVSDTRGGYAERQFGIYVGAFQGEVPLIVEGWTPETGAERVPLATTVTLIFNSPLNRSNAQSAFTLRSRAPGGTGREVEGSFQFAMNDRHLIFTPTEPLQPNTMYEILLAVTATDRWGNRLAQPDISNFHTGLFGTSEVPLPGRGQGGRRWRRPMLIDLNTGDFPNDNLITVELMDISTGYAQPLGRREQIAPFAGSLRAARSAIRRFVTDTVNGRRLTNELLFSVPEGIDSQEFLSSPISEGRIIYEVPIPPLNGDLISYILSYGGHPLIVGITIPNSKIISGPPYHFSESRLGRGIMVMRTPTHGVMNTGLIWWAPLEVAVLVNSLQTQLRGLPNVGTHLSTETTRALAQRQRERGQ